MCRPWSRQVSGFLPIWSTNGHEQSDFRTKHFKTRVPKRRTFVPGRRCSRRARSVCVPTFLRSRASGHYARYARENARCPKLAAKSLPNLDRQRLLQISKTVPFGFSPAREPATVAAQCHCPPPARPPAPSTYAAPPVSRAFLERAHHQN